MKKKINSLNHKAYNLLKIAKNDQESFSEAVIRLLSAPDHSIFLSMIGSLKDELDEDDNNEFIKEAKSAWKE